jgi:ArsR family transcriptional regulator, lead/cadmium/zinc/bismuth-responsive transcriptional repressor
MPDYSIDHQPLNPGAEDGDALCCETPHLRSAINPPDRPLTLEKAQRMSEFMGFLADTNRLRILSILADKEMCVGDLAIALESSESAVSHQLRVLRSIRLVSFRKQGRHVFYRLQDHHVLAFYQAIVEHLDEVDGD